MHGWSVIVGKEGEESGRIYLGDMKGMDGKTGAKEEDFDMYHNKNYLP